jgi:hypothetical protein
MSINKINGYQFEPAHGWLGEEPAGDACKYMIIDDRVEEVKTVVVHEFTLGDVDDPDLYAASPIWQWQNSEQGKWVIAHAVNTSSWHRMPDSMQFGYRYQIRAKLAGPALTEWVLRYGT